MQNGEILQEEALPPRSLASGGAWSFPPLALSVQTAAETLVQVAYDDQIVVFVAEYKASWQERAFQAALEWAQARRQEEPYPLVVLPYLSDERINTLLTHRISGVDLCGNGLILVPGRWLIRQSGKPNRFRIEQALRNPYQGKASLVGRTLLQQSTFPRLDDLHNEIARRGGEVSLALVSRAVQRLEEDVMTLRKEGSRVRLVQPEKLLDALVDAYEPRRVRRVWRGKVADPVSALPLLFARARERGQRAMVTGIGSATRYVPLAMESTIRLYLDPESGIESLLSELGATRTERFPNLELYTYPDATCFFEGEQDDSGVLWASPFQTYLELARDSDIRLRQSATLLRPRVLGDTDAHD